MTVQPLTSSHHTDGNAFANSGVVGTTKTFFYYNITLHKECTFHVHNDDITNTLSWELHGMHKAYNWSVNKNTTLPTDVITTEILSAAVVNPNVFSAKVDITDTDGYSHIAIGLVRSAGVDVNNTKMFGWGRSR